jgi:hypothetical protein
MCQEQLEEEKGMKWETKIKIGVHVSRVRSLTMDYCHPEIIEGILMVGYEKVASVFMAK